MRTFRFTIALAVLLAAVAGPAFAGDSYRFDRGVVAVGDSVAALRARAGAPDRIVQLETRAGGAAGERWEYYVDGKLVAFYVHGGYISSIDESTS
jgi:hypothetical protein